MLLPADPDGKNNRGSEFFLGFMYNDIDVTAARVSIFVSTLETDPVSVTVELNDAFPDPDNEWPQTKTVRYGETIEFVLPTPRPLIGGSDIRVYGSQECGGAQPSAETNKGIHVFTEGNKSISVYGLNAESVSTDTFTALPCDTYPTDQYDSLRFLQRSHRRSGPLQCSPNCSL